MCSGFAPFLFYCKNFINKVKSEKLKYINKKRKVYERNYHTGRWPAIPDFSC